MSSEHLRIRADLSCALRQIIEERALSRTGAADFLHTTVETVDAVVRAELDRLTIDALVAMLSHAGVRVELRVMPSQMHEEQPRPVSNRRGRRATGAGTTRVIAVDWSGAKRGARKHIWLAEVVDGRLVRLEAGRDRQEIKEHLIAEAEEVPELVVGLDFAFSLPAWFLEERGCDTATDLWNLVRDQGESWLAGCEPPFWGRAGRKRPDLPAHFRAADTEIESVGGISPKSPFQIGGAGAVGTGSIRGMRVLADLREAGFRIWPFYAPRKPIVVEIYPRILTGPVVKSSATNRADYISERFPSLETSFVGSIVGSEDAFDAAVSALVMGQENFSSLPVARTETERLEGRIWVPELRGR